MFTYHSKNKDLMPPFRQTKRRQAYRFGKMAEWMALFYLWLKGYRILDRCWRHAMGEVDIIATRRGMMVFIEVKARKGKAALEEVLSFKQQQRINRAAMMFIARNPAFSSYSMRFDLIVIRPYRWPLHVVNAW